MSLTADSCGPVTPGEVAAVVAELQGLAARAAEHGQQAFHFVLSIGAESLADNLSTADAWDDDE